MNTALLARKGEAVPTGLGGDNRQAFAYFAARRTVTFGQLDASHDAPSFSANDSAPSVQRPRRAASILVRPAARADARRRFTFRIDRNVHERFCAAARLLDCSRQKILEQALARYLDDLDMPDDPAGGAGLSVPRLV